MFVTGGAHGIGRATAMRLAAEGASTVIADIDEATAAEVAAELISSGAHAMSVGCDITDDDSVTAAVDRAAKSGGIDVVVNGAGGDAQADDPDNPDDAHWSSMLDLNLLGVVRCTRAALPHLRAAGNASVVTIGSINGLIAARSEPYSAAKAALQNLTVNLAARHAGDGIRVNLVVPATIRTRVWDDQPGELERLASMYPLGRVGTPADIAAAVAFLASDDAAWITGVTLPVDGGLLAAGPIPW